MADDTEVGSDSEADAIDSLMRLAAAAPEVTPLVVAPGMLVNGKYRALGLLGRGGMGEVWRAIDMRLGRTIAIKFQHGPTAGIDRLRREARALAALSHPNVVTVLEVGVHEGATFIAMEWIDGGDARRWARRAPRRWQEVVALYRVAGRGLVVAHSVGIVHRDFKPDNVLVGADRICVADFGVARMDEPDAESEPQMPGPIESGPTHPTRSDGFLGTPAYMAPEQMHSPRVDVRADQYAFCAAIYETIYGELPARSDTGDASIGVAATPVRSDRAPRWLLRVLQRGLAHDPEDRWPSMSELLERLDPARRRRWIPAAAAASVAVLGIWGLAGRSRSTPSCASGASLAEHWTPERAAAIEQRLRAAGTSANDASATRLVARLDEDASAWTQSWNTACEDPQAPRFDESLACLREHRDKLVASIELLEEADALTVANAASLGVALEDPRDCLDDQARADAPPVEIAADVERLRTAAAQVEANVTAGRFTAAREQVEPIVAEAQALGYRPLLARTLRLRGLVRLRGERFGDAYADLSDAYMIAASDRVDDLARDLASLVAVALASDGKLELALQWTDHVEGLFDGSPTQARARARLLCAQSRVLAALGRFAESEAAIDAAAAEEQRDREGLVRLDVLSARANLRYSLGEFDRAIELRREMLAASEAVLGGDHVLVASTLEALASDEIHGDHRADARNHLHRALAILERAFGPDDPVLVRALGELAHLDSIEGDPAAALVRLTRARRLAVAAGRPPDPVIAQLDDIIAISLVGLGRAAEAIDVLSTELGTLERSRGTDDPELRFVLNNMGNAAMSIDRLPEAEAWLRRAIAIDDAQPAHDYESATLHANLGLALFEVGAVADAEVEFGTALRIGAIANRPGDPDLAFAHLGLGRVLHARGDHEQSVRQFERAFETWDPGTNPAAFRELRRDLARALWDEGRDRPRALELARVGLAADPDDDALQRLIAQGDRAAARH